MWEGACGRMMPAIIIYYFLFIYYLVCAVTACGRHPAGHAIIIYLFIYSFIHNIVSAAAACVRHPAA
jgi:hypothetical protein